MPRAVGGQGWIGGGQQQAGQRSAVAEAVGKGLNEGEWQNCNQTIINACVMLFTCFVFVSVCMLLETTSRALASTSNI